MINENIAFARSILNKNGVTRDSKEWDDYLKIRSLVGANNGYVGILTKLRFTDGVEDMDEIESIFNLLKDSKKIDVNKLNKLSYDDILELFYDDLVDSDESKKDYELIYQDQSYLYYRVYTYEGILEIGSPAWCLKTKKNWVNYQKSLPIQWVIISKKYKNKLLSPNNNYLGRYTNTGKPWVRYGISINNDDNTWLGHDDNDGKITNDSSNWTAHGVVITTIKNLNRGYKKSYYERYPGCKFLDFRGWSLSLLEVTDNKLFEKSYKTTIGDWGYKHKYILFAKEYNMRPIVLLFSISGIKAHRKGLKSSDDGFITLEKLVDDYLEVNYKDYTFSYLLGICYQLGLTKISEIQSSDIYIGEFKEYFVFEKDDEIVFINKEPKKDGVYQIPLIFDDKKIGGVGITNPIFFVFNTKSKNISPEVDKSLSSMLIKEVQDYKNKKDETSDEKDDTKVRSFWNFLKNKK